MNHNYLRGRKFEYEVANHFKEMGCLTTRSSGSHGVWDVVAVATDPTTAMIVRMWLNEQDSVPEKGFLSSSLYWPGARSPKRVYYRTIQDIDHNTVVLLQCKTTKK